MLTKYHSNLTILLWWEQSVIACQLDKNQEYQHISDLVARLAEVMWNKLIFEYCVQDYKLVPVAKQINDVTMKLASQFNYLLTCANNYHYIKADEQEPFEIALAIKDQKLVQDRDRRKVVGHYHIMSEDEIRTIMKGHSLDTPQIDDMINNTITCAEHLLIKMPPLPAMFPSYDPPEHIKQLYNQVKDSLIVSE